MDAVLSYHMNGLTCGVAKFNHRLARQLGTPIFQLFDADPDRFERPLLSIKLAEFTQLDADRLSRLLDDAPWRDNYGLFLHAWSGTELEQRMLDEAAAVYCGNAELGAQLRARRADAQSLWCPGTLDEMRAYVESELTVFTFGMAHKIRARHYDLLKDRLDATGKEYSLYLSTALHEDTSFDEEFSLAFDELRKIFGDRVYFLGFLSDGAVYNYLLQTTYFAAFFDHGVRANNTSVNLAMQCGAVVITNLDEHSPASLTPMENIIDIQRCAVLPADPDTLEAIGARAKETVREHYGWEALQQRLLATNAALPARTDP